MRLSDSFERPRNCGVRRGTASVIETHSSDRAFPDGSAIYLVVEPRRRIMLSGCTAENGREPGLAFSERFWARKRR